MIERYLIFKYNEETKLTDAVYTDKLEGAKDEFYK